MIAETLVREAGGSPGDVVRMRVRFEPPRHVVVLAGELDACSRDAVADRCAAPEHLDVVVDLSALEFMDCGGYRALVTAAAILSRRGGSMVLRDPVGEPLRLLRLIGGLDGAGLVASIQFSQRVPA